MFDVFALSAPLKIIDVIIEWIAINMIYLRLVSGFGRNVIATIRWAKVHFAPIL